MRNNQRPTTEHRYLSHLHVFEQEIVGDMQTVLEQFSAVVKWSEGRITANHYKIVAYATSLNDTPIQVGDISKWQPL